MESESLITASLKNEKKKPRRSRISALLLIIAVLITLPPLLAPHVIFRVPLAVVTIIGLWNVQRWAYPLLWVTGVVWLLMFFVIAPFLLIAPPWVLWMPWIYWLIPTILVLTACVLMTTAKGRAERAGWA
jgi:hypothetical protein